METQGPNNENSEVLNVDDEQEKKFSSALNYLSYLGVHLSVDAKQRLVQSMGNFNLPGQRMVAFRIVTNSEVLSDEQAKTILECLFDKVLLTRLIMAISARKILKVPTEGVKID